MKLRELSLRLFRQHVSSDIFFTDGLTGVVGSNGAGKTTIVEAIGFAIYGSRALRGKVEDVRTRTAAAARSGRMKRGEQDLRVILSLEHDGVIFRIERTLSEAVLYVGGEAKPVAVGTRDVSTRIGTIVGMTYDEFTSTYCTEQKGLEFLSGKKGATEREKFIVRMMGFDRLEEMQELLRSDRKDRRSTLAGYEASLGSREEIERRFADEQTELELIRVKHDEAARALAKSEQDFAGMRDRLSKLEHVRQRYVKDREAVQAYQVRLEERLKRRASLTEQEGLIEEEIERARRALSESSAVHSEISEVSKKIDLARLTHSDLLAEAKKIELAWRDQSARASAEREGVVRQRDALKKRGDRLDALEAGGECPTCGQELGDSFDQVKSHFAQEITALDSRITEIDGVIREVSKRPEELAGLEDAIRESEAQMASLERALKDLTHIDQIREKLRGVAREKTTVAGEITLAEENLKLATGRLSELRFSEEEYLKEKGAHDAAQRLVEVSRLQRVRLEGEVNTREALVQRSRAELLKYDERRVELERLRKEVRTFDECDRILSEFRRYVNTSIRPRLAELASEYLADLTDGRYTAVELEEDFTPTVVEDGEVKRVISGGEEDILNLCMRISLSHMLAERAGQHFSLLILDEVFGSLDEGRRSNVLSLLEKLRKRFEQIIIITHLDDVKEGVQHLIQIDYDEGSGTAHVVSREEAYPLEELVYNF